MEKLISFLTEKTGEARRDLSALAIVFGFLYLQMLWHFPLMDPDEGRYAEIPREMLEKMDFITPTLNYVKYFEKPPLLYWMNALSFSIFGQNEFAARMPCAISGLLTILFTYWLGRKLFGRRTGVIAAVGVGTSAGFFAMSRIALTDMPLTFCMTLCLGSFIMAVKDDGKGKSFYYYLFYTGAALAVLAKGLIGILFPGTIIFLFMLFQKRWKLLKEMRIFTGLILFFLIAAPWFVLVSLKNPEFARFFFIHEHFERFLTKVHGRYQPLWYFIPLLFGIMLPWSCFSYHAMREAWQNRIGKHGEILAWLAIWAIFIFIFFSKSNSKLPPYILPVVPPLSLIIAWYFDRAEECGRVFRGKFIAMAAVITIIVANIASYFVYANLSLKKTSKTMALKVNELSKQGDLVASFGYDQTLPFYSKRRIVVVGGMSELEFGSKQGDQSEWFIDNGRFMKEWNSDRRVFLILRNHELESNRNLFKNPPIILSQHKKDALVTNH
ncbi:MAG: glycosyltransferase family 39 protein [Geobacteraceae bacterium]|nr:glycosyltransferase family 39 protein [Geobacteraceae bacterium]